MTMFHKVMFTSSAFGATAALVLDAECIDVQNVSEVSRLYPYGEGRKMRQYWVSPAYATFNEALAHVFPCDLFGNPIRATTRMKQHGFRRESTGGNCSAWVRENGTATEYVTDGDGRASEVSDMAYLSVDTPYGARFYLWDTLTQFCDHLDAHGGDLSEANCEPFKMSEAPTL